MVSCCCPTPPAPFHKTLSEISSSGVIACLRAPSADVAREAAGAALSSGISVLEIVMSTPRVFQVVADLVRDYPTSTIGVGTVLNPEDAKKAVDCGAKFLMSPATVTGILDNATKGEFLYIPGVMTPTEILAAHTAGAHIVKVYPVSALGGVQYISALNKPFHHIPMVASQGITLDSIAGYIACGAVSVVLSEAIFDKDAISHKNFKMISQLAYAASSAAKEALLRRHVLQQLDKGYAESYATASQRIYWRTSVALLARQILVRELITEHPEYSNLHYKPNRAVGD